MAGVGAEIELEGRERHTELESPGANHVEAEADAQTRHVLKAIASEGEVYHLQYLIDDGEYEAASRVPEQHASAKYGKHVQPRRKQRDAQCLLRNYDFSPKQHPNSKRNAQQAARYLVNGERF